MFFVPCLKTFAYTKLWKYFSLFSSEGFIVLPLPIRPMIHRELSFEYMQCKTRGKIHSFPCGHPSNVAPFAERTNLSPLHCGITSVFTNVRVGLFLDPVLFQQPSLLRGHQHHQVSGAVTLKQVLIHGKQCESSNFAHFQDCLDHLWPFLFPHKF